MKTRVASALFVLIIIATTAYAQPRYLLTVLGPIDGTSIYAPARAINNHRQIICCAGPKMPLFMWDKGMYTSLGILAPQTVDTTKCMDINDVAQVTGMTSGERPCLWQNGTIIDLGVPYGARGAASGINSLGQVVGWYNNRTFLWDNGILTDITPPEWLGATRGYAINLFGTIVGRIGQTSAIWSNGQAITLDAEDAKFGEAFGVNDKGAVVGWLSPNGGPQTAYMYNNGRIFHLGALTGSIPSRANTINNREQIVGYSIIYHNPSGLYPPPPGLAKRCAVIWDNGILYNLNDLIDPDLDIDLQEAWDINERGDIVGTGYVDGKGKVGFLLTPWLQQVSVDVCPGVEPNKINVNGKQPVPVAVLSSDEFNTTSIDYASVRFAGAKPYRRTFADINRDRKRDAIFWLRANELELYSGTAVVELTGRTLEGRPFKGEDEVVAIGGSEEPLPMEPHFIFEELKPLPNDTLAVAHGINDMGQVVGQSNSKPCLWDKGRVISLNIPNKGTLRPVDINNSGQIAVSHDLNTTDCFIWQNGIYTKVEIPDCTDMYLSAINNSGVIVGRSHYKGIYSNADYAFIWQNGQGHMLNPYACRNSYYASCINDYGLIVGHFIDYYAIAPGYTPCFWINGEAVALPIPESSLDGMTRAVNNYGVIVGYGRFPHANGYRSFIWRNGVPELLKQMDTGSDSSAYDINDWEQIVGWSRYDCTTGPTVGVMWHCGLPYDLNEVTAGIPEDYSLTSTKRINNNGQIIGEASKPGFTTKACILTPVPTQVTIDIKPGDSNNVINTRSNGSLPVVLYSSREFTTASLLAETITLAGAKPYDQRIVNDMNGDGRRDMLLMFRSNELDVNGATSEASLTGRTFDGWWVEGNDKIRVLPGSKK